MARKSFALIAAVIILGLGQARAQTPDKLTLALGQRGNWDTAIAQLGQDAGIFKKHGLTLDILWTQGAGESQQVLLAGSADLGLLGTQSAFAIFAKGAPVRIVTAEATGAADYWYVRTEFANQIVQGHRRKDGRLLHRGRFDQYDGARVCR